jgi:hypothetical protein
MQINLKVGARAVDTTKRGEKGGTMPRILHICNWHHAPTAMDAETGELIPGASLDGLDSHGICAECLKRVRAEEMPGQAKAKANSESPVNR